MLAGAARVRTHGCNGIQTILRPALPASQFIRNFNGRRRVYRAFENGDGASDIPEWFLNLKDLATEGDEELAELLREAKGDPSILEAKLKREMEALHDRIAGDSFGGGSGEEMPPKVEFRETDPFETWIWIELYESPSGGTGELIQEVLNSWYMLGKLGGYNAANLQVLYSDGAGPGFDYEEPDNSMQCTMHEMGELEVKGTWARFCVDMGTSDELAFDVLINALRTFSREHVGIRRIVFGGENDDWKLPER
jgi:hypothetical protein